jgi:hypothetical protein
VKAFPTFLVWQDGRVIQRQVGACSIEKLRAMLVPVTVNYQGVASETFHRVEGEPGPKFVPGWYDFAPLAESPPGLSPTHTDIMRHVEPGTSLRAKYEPQGPLMWAHEEVHVINSTMSNALGGGVWAFYMLDGKGFALRAPRLKKTIVDQMTPDNMRSGQSWQLYMTGPVAFSNQDHPFVILDEWVAYIASAKVANEMYGAAEQCSARTVQLGAGVSETTAQNIIDRGHAIEFAGYATVLLQCIERFEPDYPDLEKLREFVAVNIQRTVDVQVKPITVAYQQYFRRFNGNCQFPSQQQPSQQVRPAQPSPAPLQPPPAKPCNCETRIAALELRIKELESRKPLKGDKGEPGEKGPAGPQGAPGKDAQPPAIDAIAAEVIKQIPANTLELWEDGKLVDSLPVPVGGRIPITRESIKVK